MDQNLVPTQSPRVQALTASKDGISAGCASTTSRDAIAGMMRLETELLAWERSATPAERPARSLASEAIRTARKRRQTELQLTGLSSLPEYIAGLEWIETLTLTDCAINKIDVLPPALKHLHASSSDIVEITTIPETVQSLILGHNRIETFTSLPPNLLTLHAECNQLRLLPELPATLINLHLADNQLHLLPTLPSSLRMLDVHANKLIALPEIPPSITMLDATSNYLGDIPDSLTRIARPWKVLLEHNPMSEAVLERIETLLKSRDGPELFLQRDDYPDAPVNNTAVMKVSAVSQNGLVLESQIDYWCSLAGLEERDVTAVRHAWAELETNIAAEQDGTKMMPFVRILEALQTIAAEEPLPVREMLAERVAALLEEIASEPALMSLMLDTAQKTQIKVQGRPVAGLHVLELAKQRSDAKKAGHDRENLIVLGNRINAETVLAELVEDSAAYNPRDASIRDVTLACQIQLYRLLWLPEPSLEQMQWAAEHITDTQADAIAKLLEDRLSDPQMRATFFAEWEPWLTYLHSQMPPELFDASLQMMAQTDRLNERWSALEIKLELATAMVGRGSASAMAIQDEQDGLEDEYQRLHEELLGSVRRNITLTMLGALPD
jgi:hypothetical protein